MYCDIKFSVDICLNSQEIPNNDKRKYNISSIPNDLLVDEEIQAQLFEAIHKIGNYLEISKDVQNVYDEFQLFVKSEMENKLPTYESSRRDKRRKLRYKPYWNEHLSFQWKKVCESENICLRFTGANSMKRKLKEEYCIQWKTFDRLNRKYKRQFQAQERQKIEDNLSEINQHDFWKSIGNIGIANERQNCIPLAVVDNDGSINTEKMMC